VISASDTLSQRKRLGIVVGFLFVCGVVVSVRLAYLQLWQHSRYLAEATLEQTRKYEVPATRGDLYVHDGNGLSPIALNQTLSVLYADPSYVGNHSVIAGKLAAVTGGSVSDYKAKLDAGIEYAKLADRVPDDVAAKIKALKLPGVGLAGQDYRVYPEGSLAAQVLGFVNADGDGQYGVEGYLNGKLAGTPGRLAAKTDTHGIPIATAENIQKAPVDGASYVLTIDRNIQAMAESELKSQVDKTHAKSGSIVVLDPSSGAVRAMATYPTFDPNNFSAVKDYSVFLNQPVSGAFEPGSGMKTFTMAAGLDQGKVTPDTTYDDPFCYQVDDRQVCDAKTDHAGKGKSMTVVLRDSLNTGAMFVLRMLGGDPGKFTLAGKKTLYNYFTKHFGFGTPTGIEQAGEEGGTVPEPSNAAGNNVTYANMTFGQGMSVNMVQMTAAMASIANGGKLYQPHVIDGVMNDDGTMVPEQPKLENSHTMNPTAISQLTQMLEVVVQHGSGYLAGGMNPGYKIAGKTGTAQIPNPNGQGYLEDKNIGSFLGFAPADNPKFVVMVRINEPGEKGYAETTTVPVFGDVCKWLFKYYGIPPTS
jgi:cell division protein FtsI/penicillin-binding protein 2